MTPRTLRTTLLLAACGLLVGHALVFDFVNDDAYISFRYADNLVRHGELVFNLGERVEGYTNFLWTMLMAGVIGVGGDPVGASKWLGIALALGTLLVVTRFLARWRGEPRPEDAVVALLLAAAPAYACWATGGLETALFTFTFTLGFTAFLLEQRDATRWPLSGVYFALSAMTRPEGLLLFGLTGLYRAADLLRTRRWPTRTDWLFGLGFAALFGPYFAWRYSYYGWPFPNTYYIKTGTDAFWAPGGNYLWSWVKDHHLYLVPFIAASGFRANRRLFVLLGLYIVAIGLHVTRVGGDFMGLHRFFVPIMPAVYLLAVLGGAAFVRQLRARLVPAQALALAGAVFVGFLGFRAWQIDRAALEPGSEGGVDRIGWLKMFEGQCTAIGLWLRDNVPPDTSIATTAAGIIPYYSRLYTLDVLGLNDEYIAHEVPPRGSRPGHTRVAPLEYVMKKQIDLLVYHPNIAAKPPTATAGEVRAWKSRGYTWRTVEVPGLSPPFWGFWQRDAR